MLMPRRLRSALLAASTVALLAGSAAAQNAEPVKIGVLLGITGPLASFVPPILDSIRLARDQINKQGGLLDKRTLDLVTADTQTTAQGAVDAANKLVGVENVAAILGGLSSGGTLAAASSVAVPNGVPMVSPTATSPELTTLDDKDYLFRVVPGDDYQGKVLARIVKEDGLDKVAVTYVNNDYGVGIASAFKREFEQAGGTVTGFQAHEENKSSYRSELATLAGGDARALVVVGYAGGSGVTIIRQALENGFFDRFIGTDGMRDALLIQQIGGDNLASTFFTAPASPPESEAQATFAKAYAAAFETTQDKLFIQQAYDALMVLALAIEKAGSTDRDAIRDALRDVANAPGEKILPGEWEKAKKLIADGQDVDYEGAGGPQDFDENGDVAGFIGKYVVENNSFKEVGVY
ncbi:MAG: ABC transporter substrate-binding protein [Geminicoccaceae bacterium]|nr:ABC transporter substrate-binding protein [Geminicoccaceae bacterium]